MDFLFGKPPDPLETAKRWKTSLLREQRAIQRQIRTLELEENKVKASIKLALKRGGVSPKSCAAPSIHYSPKLAALPDLFSSSYTSA